MPDGTLMSDVEHARLYGSPKKIKSFVLDTSHVAANGETRGFSVFGDNGAMFSLEIKNEDNYYYNFVKNEFQAAKAKLDNQIISGRRYYGSITFPSVSDADQYDIYLFAEPGTKHVDYSEVRFEDNSVDINSSIGSNSLLLQKVIYQTLDVTLTLSTLSPNSVTAFTGHSPTTQAIVIPINKNTGKKAFSIPVSAAATHSFKINKIPTIDDIAIWVTRTIGSAPDDIPGENIYPTARAAFTGDDINGAITSGSVVRMDAVDLSAVIEVGDKITTAVMTDTVNGTVSSGVNVIMDAAVATKMAVGDRVTTSGVILALDTKVVTVAAINVGSDVNTFALSEAVGISDGVTLTFSSKINRSITTVTVVETSGTATDFTMSQAIQFRDNTPLTFTPRENYRWPLNNIDGLTAGMTPLATNIASGSTISSYKDILTVMEGTKKEEKITSVEIKAIDKLGVKPTITRHATTKAKIKTQVGNIVFNKQQAAALADDTVKIYSFGPSAIKALSGWEIELSDVIVTLTKPTTTTTQTTTNLTTITVASGNGIMDDISTVNSVSIDPSTVDPTITTIGSYSGTTATLTLSAAQSFENGETLTFDGAGRTITIAGNIEIKKSEQIRSDWNGYLYFDVERFLTATDES